MMNHSGTPAMLSAMDEQARLAALTALQILDTPAEADYDAITALARHLLGTEIAAISLMDADRQWFKAKCGMGVDETPREVAFCAHTIGQQRLMVVPDASRDPRFAANPLVTGAPHIRFYAGVPLRVEAGDGGPQPIGTLCVLHRSARHFSPADEAALSKLAGLAEALLGARMAAQRAGALAEQRREVLEALEISHRQFRQAERMASIGSWRYTIETHHLEWSDNVFAIHHLPPGRLPAVDHALEFYPAADRARIEAAMARAIDAHEPFDLEVDFTTATGIRRRVRTMCEVELRNGRTHSLVGAFQDITDRYRMEQALRHTAHTDELTGLASRARFIEEMDALLPAARAAGRPLALLLIDLDNFKTVNDRCGHLAGDDMLRTMAGKMRLPAIAHSLAARLGGDEFVIAVEDPHALADLPGLIGALLANMRHEASCAGGSIPASATIGAAYWDDDVVGRSELLHRADLALYQAKRARRGSGMIYGQERVIEPA